MQYIVTLTLIFLSLAASGQKQNNSWCFGNKAGLDFNGGAPVAFSSAINCGEGSASVSNRHTGALLFYTDGVRIYNRDHNIMPYGNNIGNDLLSSSLQGMLIVPFTDDSNKYYVFALEDESRAEGALFYSVVDMQLDAGRGDVMLGRKKIMLGKGFVEGMQAVPTCDGHWLLLASRTANEFHAYKITANGIDTQAVVSQMFHPYVTSVLGAMKISPDRRKLLYATYTSKQVGGQNYAVATINDFDERTGKVTGGEHLIDPTGNATYYSVEFSEDGTKAYVCDTRYGIYQFDLSLPTPLDIKASKKVVYQNITGSEATLMQMGPDKNIYVAIYGAGYVDRISNTNAAVPAVMYTRGAVNLAAGTTSFKSFPPEVTYPEAGSLDVYTSTDQKDICKGSSTKLEGKPGALTYLWQDSSTQNNYTTGKAGTYWVKSLFLCWEQIDTFNVGIINLSVELGKDTTICTGKPLVVSARANADSAIYTWHDGSAADSFVISRAGTYWVMADFGLCIARDTIRVLENDSAYFSMGRDTILCMEETYNLYVPEDVLKYNWSTGDKDSMITVDKADKYFLEVERGGCSYTDTVEVLYAEPPYLGNDTVLCNGDEHVLNGRSILSSYYTWNTGEMLDSIILSTAGLYTLTVENRCGVTRDSIQIDYKVCDCDPYIPNAFTPNNDGRNDMFGPLMKCRIESYEFIVVNRFGEVLFRSTDRMQKWDGTYKGRPCDVGGYYYLLRLKNISGKDDLRKGDVILIR